MLSLQSCFFQEADSANTSIPLLDETLTNLSSNEAQFIMPIPQTFDHLTTSPPQA
jgi:hypothetical protein